MILGLTYGYPSDLGDPLGLIKIAQDAMEGFSVASEPGRWWVDSIPARRKDIVIFMLKTNAVAVKYLPPWFPGASFQREAQRMRADLDKLFEVPYQFVKNEIVSSILDFCIYSNRL